ncbi:MAG: hypothetical protein AB1416_05530 [Actinomycetota bacterium]
MPVLAAFAAAAVATATTAPLPPWRRNPPIAATSGDARVVAREWRVADNRDTCAPLSFATVRAGGISGARARRAVFAGGWGVAWDIPGQRSAFGVAGAGVDAEPEDITRWPNVIRWRDGSAAGYGLTGDTGPGYLAYVKVAGQGCLYNVWSNVSRRHLRLILSHLRRVR